VFTEPLPKTRLHNPVAPFLRVLLRNCCLCGSTVLAWSKYATVYIFMKSGTGLQAIFKLYLRNVRGCNAGIPIGRDL
jgi:hypothetical protein